MTYLDLATLSWGKLSTIGDPPQKRMSAVMALAGTALLVYGGWIYSQGEVGAAHLCALSNVQRNPSS